MKQKKLTSGRIARDPSATGRVAVGFLAPNIEVWPSALGRVESVDLTGTGRSRWTGKVAALVAAVQRFADVRGVDGRLDDGRLAGSQREFASPDRPAAIAALQSLNVLAERCSAGADGTRHHRSKAVQRSGKPS